MNLYDQFSASKRPQIKPKCIFAFVVISIQRYDQSKMSKIQSGWNAYKTPGFNDVRNLDEHLAIPGRLQDCVTCEIMWNAGQPDNTFNKHTWFDLSHFCVWWLGSEQIESVAYAQPSNTSQWRPDQANVTIYRKCIAFSYDSGSMNMNMLFSHSEVSGAKSPIMISCHCEVSCVLRIPD